MELITEFPFVNLSTELCLRIFAHAARPTFTHTDNYDAKNPYSSALPLCRVSRIVRRAVLPELLGTVLLSEDNNVAAFVHALHLQKAYADQGHHLHFSYATHVRRIWVGEILEPFHDSPSSYTTSCTPHKPEIYFSLLAPVLLGAQSLALDSSSLFLLHGCLDYAWHSHIDTKSRSSPPWSSKTLTLSGARIPWHLFTSTTVGSAFLASISDLVFLSPTLVGANLLPAHNACLDDTKELRNYNPPSWTMGIPWTSFKNLQAVSLAFPQLLSIAGCQLSGRDVHIELRTFSAPQLLHHRVTQEAGTYTGESREGRLDDVRVSISHSRIHFCILCQDWEKAWACGLCSYDI